MTKIFKVHVVSPVAGLCSYFGQMQDSSGAIDSSRRTLDKDWENLDYSFKFITCMLRDVK